MNEICVNVKSAATGKNKIKTSNFPHAKEPLIPLKQAQKAGHHTKYVLFDSWFFNPKEIIRISEDCHLDSIAMVKKSSKICYEFEDEKLNIKQIFARSKKRRGRSRYLLSVKVKVSYTDEKNVFHTIPAKIVCVRNRSNRKDWLAIICTDIELDEKEIIRIYGKRWDIEVFFKTCKQMLKLESEFKRSVDSKIC